MRADESPAEKAQSVLPRRYFRLLSSSQENAPLAATRGIHINPKAKLTTMATRKTATQINPVSVIAMPQAACPLGLALKEALTKSDYSRIITANKLTDVEAAWATLSSEDQQRITGICNGSPPPDLQRALRGKPASLASLTN